MAEYAAHTSHCALDRWNLLEVHVMQLGILTSKRVRIDLERRKRDTYAGKIDGLNLSTKQSIPP